MLCTGGLQEEAVKPKAGVKQAGPCCMLLMECRLFSSAELNWCQKLLMQATAGIVHAQAHQTGTPPKFAAVRCMTLRLAKPEALV